MRILVSNDDGIESNGTRCLAHALAPLGEVTVVVPHRERSTSGHALTLHKPLRIFKHEPGYYSTTGTPADSVFLGIRGILQDKPDLVVTGVNAGANLGTDIFYSGTVAAAREGALLEIPSYAFSLANLSWQSTGITKEPWRFDTAAEVALRVIQRTRHIRFPARTLLNVNVPNLPLSEIRGLKVARQGIRFYSNEVIKRTDPRGKDYFWIGGTYQGYKEDEDTDCHYVEQGYVSIVPVSIDGTHESFYMSLSKELPSPLE